MPNNKSPVYMWLSIASFFMAIQWYFVYRVFADVAQVFVRSAGELEIKYGIRREVSEQVVAKALNYFEQSRPVAWDWVLGSYNAIPLIIASLTVIMGALFLSIHLRLRRENQGEKIQLVQSLHNML